MIRDFWGVETGTTLKAKARLVVSGGEPVDLRPLSVERLMKLLSLPLAPLPAKEVLSEMTPEQIEALFALQLKLAAEIALSLEGREVPADALTAALVWYKNEHDWRRIHKTFLEKDDAPSAGKTTLTFEDLLYTIEVASGRTIESQLAMRPEAWISLLEIMERRMEREKASVSASYEPGAISAQGLDAETMFTLIPGGEVVYMNADGVEGEAPPDGGQ